MIKFNKRSVFSLALCVMLVFCIGFYSSAQPTTAWFSQLNDDTVGQYSMEELYVEFTGDRLDKNSTRIDLEFKASTKLEDKNERENMFEHTAEFYVFSAKNVGTLPAEINIDIVDSSTQGDIMTSDLEDNGVRYFIYEFDASEPADSAAITGILGIDKSDPNYVYKEVFVDTSEEGGNRRVIKYGDNFYPTRLEQNLLSKISDNQKWNTSDEQVSFLLDNIDADSLVLEPDAAEKLYCICFWIEYEAFESIVPNEDSGLRTFSCNVDVRLNAVQHIDSQASAQN